MALKPAPRTAVLVQERVKEALHGHKLSEDERQQMEEFDRDLEKYLS